MKFWKRVASSFKKFAEELIDESQNNDNDFITYKGKQEERHWCPLCGYSGTADNLRCHLLNHHR